MAGASDGSVTRREGVPFAGAEVHGGFFERAVVVAQPRGNHDRDVGDGKGYMGNDDCVQAEPQVQESEGPLEQREQRNAGDDFGRYERQIERAGETRAERRRQMP